MFMLVRRWGRWRDVREIGAVCMSFTGSSSAMGVWGDLFLDHSKIRDLLFFCGQSISFVELWSGTRLFSLLMLRVELRSGEGNHAVEHQSGELTSVEYSS